MKKLSSALVMMGLLLGVPAAGWAATITIGPTNSLQEAIDSASDGDTIVMLAGVYGAAETNAIVIQGKSNLTIQGQGSGPLGTIFRPLAGRVGSTTLWEGGNNWPPAIFVGNSTNIHFQSLQFDFINIAGGARYLGVGVYNSTGTKLVDCLLQNMTPDDGNVLDWILRVQNDSPWSPDNLGTLEIDSCEFYNTGRIAIYARNFVDLVVRDTVIQKSKSITSFGYGIEMHIVGNALVTNSIIRNFRAPAGDNSASAGVLLGQIWPWPGEADWVAANGVPTSTVTFVDSQISDNKFGIFAGNYFGRYFGANYMSRRDTTLNLIRTDVFDNLSYGLYLRDNTASFEGYEETILRTEVTDSRFFGNLYGIWQLNYNGYSYRMPLTIEGSSFFDHSGNFDVLSGNGTGALPASDLSFSMTGSRVERFLQTVGFTGTTYQARSYSGNYWGEANPDLIDRWYTANTLPVITNLYTDAALTQSRDVIVVGSTNANMQAPYGTIEEALAVAGADTIIYIFSAAAEHSTITNTVTIDQDVTIWTSSGLALTGSGELVVEDGVTLTLDGIDIKGIPGDLTIAADTASIIENRAPIFGADGSSIAVRGNVAWLTNTIEVLALVSPTATAPVGATTSGWAQVISLGTVSEVGAISGQVTNLASNTEYDLLLAAVLQANPAQVDYSGRRSFELVEESAAADIASTNNNVALAANVGTNQSYSLTSYQGSLSDSSVVRTTNLTTSGVFETGVNDDEDGVTLVARSRTVDGETAELPTLARVRRTYEPDTWNLVSLAWDFSDFPNGNTIGGELGNQLGSGLLGDSLFGVANDQLYVPNGSGGWHQFRWESGAWEAIGGASLTNAVDPLIGFWLKTSADGADRVAVYNAVARSGAQSISVPTGWSILAWPLPVARTEADGWGFPRSQGADAYTGSAKIFTDTGAFLQLRADGRWYASGSSTPAGASVSLGPGSTFFYLNDQDAAFTWTVE